MPILISSSKSFSTPLFNTFVPQLSDNANIQEALELFYYGDSTVGSEFNNVNSIYANLLNFDTKINANESSISGHTGSTTVHGATGAVVGTTNTQTLTNKTLTTPKINENVNLTATSTEINHVAGVTSAIQTQINTITPVGTIVMFGASASPVGWLLCDGGSTAGYAALAAVVGPNVPDLRGRAPIGFGTSADAGITARTTLGNKTGAETVTLAAEQIPNHSHGGQIVFGIGQGAGTSGVDATRIGNSQPNTGGVVGTTNQAHPNMQPSTVVNFIIKH